MTKNTKYLLIGAAVLLVAYLLFSKSSPVKLGAGVKSSSTGGSTWLTGAGSLLTGASNMWDSVFGSSSSGDSSGGYTPAVTQGEDMSF
jgi:hypothetical protein